MLDLNGHFWRDSMMLEGSGTAHIPLTKKNTRNKRAAAEEHLLDSPPDAKHTVLTKNKEQVTAVRHSEETEARLNCLNTIKSGEDAAQKLWCPYFSH